MRTMIMMCALLWVAGCGGAEEEEEGDPGNAALDAIDLSSDIASMSEDDLCKLANGSVVEAYEALSDDELCYALANTFGQFGGTDFAEVCNDFYATCGETVSFYRIPVTTCTVSYTVSDDCDATAQEYVDCSTEGIAELAWVASFECNEPADLAAAPDSSLPSARCAEVLSCLQAAY